MTNENSPLPETSLHDKLARLRAASCAEMPTPELAVMARTIARLRRQGIQQTCLQPGETVPDFEYINHDNAVGRFYETLKKGPAVLNFFRGYWCPYCRTEVEAYEAIQPELDALGCTYFAISPQKPSEPGSRGAGYEILFDKGNRIAHQFGIVYALIEEEKKLFASWGLHLDQVNESGTWELPVPATFLVRQDRTIGYEFVDVDFRSRCCPDQLMQELRSTCTCRSD